VSCAICGDVFDNEWGLVGHQQKHVSGNDTVECGLCGEEFRDPAVFNRHKQTHLANRRDPVVCAECGKECKNHRHLKLHTSRKHTAVDRDDDSEDGSDEGAEQDVKAQILHELRVKHYRPIARIAEEYDVPPEYVAELNSTELDNEGYRCLKCDDVFASKSSVGTHLSCTHGESGRGVADRLALKVRERTETSERSATETVSGEV
jgi:uncharacterized C2H2 Zn-finger protein